MRLYPECLWELEPATGLLHKAYLGEIPRCSSCRANHDKPKPCLAAAFVSIPLPSRCRELQSPSQHVFLQALCSSCGTWGHVQHARGATLDCMSKRRIQARSETIRRCPTLFAGWTQLLWHCCSGVCCRLQTMLMPGCVLQAMISPGSRAQWQKYTARTKAAEAASQLLPPAKRARTDKAGEGEDDIMLLLRVGP